MGTDEKAGGERVRKNAATAAIATANSRKSPCRKGLLLNQTKHLSCVAHSEGPQRHGCKSTRCTQQTFRVGDAARAAEAKSHPCVPLPPHTASERS